MNNIVEVNWVSQVMADGCIIVTPLLTCSSHLYNCQSMGKIAFGANVYTLKLLENWCCLADWDSSCSNKTRRPFFSNENMWQRLQFLLVSECLIQLVTTFAEKFCLTLLWNRKYLIVAFHLVPSSANLCQSLMSICIFNDFNYAWIWLWK